MKLLLYLALFSVPVVAQSQSRLEFWSKLHVNKQVSAKWMLGVDGQFRTQSNYHHESRNPFSHRMMYSARTHANFRLSDRYTFVSAPLAVFENIEVPVSRQQLRPVFELRTAYGISRDDKVGAARWRNRVVYEARFLELTEPSVWLQHRYRWHTGLVQPLVSFTEASELKFLLSNELFLRTQRGHTGFDQNRTIGGFQISVNHADLLFAYQFTAQRIINNHLERQALLFFTTLNF